MIRDFNHDLVVHLQDHFRSKATFEQFAIQHNQSNLENIGSKTLDTSIHGLAFSRHPPGVIGVLQIGNQPATTKQRFGVPLVPSLSHRDIHKRPHIRKGDEVGIEYFGGFFYRHVQALCQTVRLHAVRQAVGHHFCLGAHHVRNVGCFNMENPCRRFRVHISTGHKRFNQARIIRQMGNYPQLNLVVVGYEERAALRRNKRPTELSAFFRANRDVVQVWSIRRQPSGTSHRLVKRGMNTSIRGNLGQQIFAVG